MRDNSWNCPVCGTYLEVDEVLPSLSSRTWGPDKDCCSRKCAQVQVLVLALRGVSRAINALDLPQ